MELKNYLEQHESIQEEINVIKKLTSVQNAGECAKDIALHVSTLAGKIKVHLSMEDKYLYPRSLESGNEQVKKLATAYQSEMGELAEAFVQYKDQYNTVCEILKNIQNLKVDTQDVFGKIEKRIQKEEKELYKFI